MSGFCLIFKNSHNTTNLCNSSNKNHQLLHLPTTNKKNDPKTKKTKPNNKKINIKKPYNQNPYFFFLSSPSSSFKERLKKDYTDKIAHLTLA